MTSIDRPSPPPPSTSAASPTSTEANARTSDALARRSASAHGADAGFRALLGARPRRPSDEHGAAGPRLPSAPGGPLPPTSRPRDRAIPSERSELAHDGRVRERDGRREQGREASAEDLGSFRMLPSVLLAAQAPSAARPLPTSHEVLGEKLAEQLVTRLRVGRAREGALVELRLALPGHGDVDVRLVEGAAGIAIEASGASAELVEALRHELARRGVRADVDAT